MIAALHGLRLAFTAILLVGVYNGSRLALVLVLGLLILGNELTASYARRVARGLDATIIRGIARAHAPREGD
jgi:hypothetical protein